MKPMKNLAQYYVDLLVKLGIVRFSILLAFAMVSFAVMVQVGVTLILSGRVDNLDVIRSVTFALLITPWAAYFLSIVVDQLEDSRQRLSKMVSKLSEMRRRDQYLNSQLHKNIEKLNKEIDDRIKAEEARKEAMIDLKNEISQREKTQLDLAEQTILLRSFIDASPDLIYYRNSDGSFSGCNLAMEKLTGKRESKLVGLTPWDVYSKETAQQVVDTDRKVFTEKKAVTYEQWFEYPDGKKRLFEMRKVPFYSRNGSHLGLVGFGRDITQRKRNQESLEKASRDKTKFISTISHELRTPLNGIVGLSRMLLETTLTSEQRKYLQTVYASAITLGHIFNDIIDMDKFDRRKLELLPESLNLDTFMTEIESISALMAEQKGLRFEFERLSDIAMTIEADATRLRQILWNVISNAVKFTKSGCVIMTIDVDKEIDAADKKNYVHIQIEVEDTGIGIPKSELDRIFAMYYQVKSGKDNLHAVGTGIGLSVSRQLINLMNGDISVSSEEGFGSVFTISIKVPIVQEPAELIVPVPQKQLNIFMVEDIELNVIVARSLLESLGHTVSVAMTGEEAKHQFKPEYYDLVLLDIQLPDMTGFDVASYYRNKYSELPPLVALTANVIKDKTEYVAKGMDDIISKPLSVTAIQDVLSKLTITQRPIATQRIDAQSEHQSIINDNNLKRLDIDMLASYISIIGTQSVLDNMTMFKETMPRYIKQLESSLAAKDQDGIVFEAHKIKGAAAAIGLKEIQQLAQKAQSPELTDWWGNIANWVSDIVNQYQQDLQTAQEWVRQNQ